MNTLCFNTLCPDSNETVIHCSKNERRKSTTPSLNSINLHLTPLRNLLDSRNNSSILLLDIPLFHTHPLPIASLINLPLQILRSRERRQIRPRRERSRRNERCAKVAVGLRREGLGG